LSLLSNSPVADENAVQVGRNYAIASGILGWTLDAFDFFVLVFMVDVVAAHFSVKKGAIILTFGLTLALRPVGALLFGALADRYGRRKPLMVVVLYFSIIELLSGFSPNYPAFLVLRALYGIGMGGFWGVGASLTMEASPKRWRGLFSGILQAGYPFGYLLAAVAARLILPHWGWRPMFWCGLFPAAVTIYLAYKAPEPIAWKQHRSPNLPALFHGIWIYRKDFAYLLVTLTFMVCLSHGTQDLYPDFLKEIHNFAPGAIAYLAMLYNVGGILGSAGGGYVSERLGRRKSIMAALALCLVVMPLWSFGRGLFVLGAAAFFMQVGVQGAWGVMPAHLNELSPDAVRSLFSGLLYQLGVLFASPTNTIEYRLKDSLGYSWALFSFEGFTIAALICLFLLGPEKKGRSFVRQAGCHEGIPIEVRSPLVGNLTGLVKIC